jgi:hypothetical protein
MKGSIIMRTQRISRMGIKAAVVALVTAAAGSFSGAQEYIQGPVQRPIMTVTAGQAGYIALPDLRAPESVYALTGSRDSSEANRAWQHAAGPMLRVGNATIVLPQSR